MITRRRRYIVFKRGIDIVGAGIGIILLSPVLGVTALLVRAKLGSPVMFKQDRPGRDGKIFKLYKFRTMVNVDERQNLVLDAERITSFGKALRSTSLDELPSFWNVLRGDMSLVGPRPLLVEYLGLYTPEQSRRHEVRPGVTGLAQVSGRNAITWEEKFAHDIRYVQSMSLMLDLKIIGATVWKVFKRKDISSTDTVTMPKFMGIAECKNN